MDLSRTDSEINGDFSRKSQLSPNTDIFNVPAEGVPLRIGYRRTRSENQNDGATGPRKTFDDIFSWLDTVHDRVRRTDRRTDTGRQRRKTAITHSVSR